MFLEYFQQMGVITEALQKTIIPGTKVCHFAIHSASEVPSPSHIKVKECVLEEVLFCTKGSLTIQQEDCRPHIMQKGDIMVLPGEIQTGTVQFPVTVEGILVVFQKEEQEIWKDPHFSSVLGEQYEMKWQEQGEICLVQDHIWNQAVFMVLDSMSGESRMAYCVWKAVELQFLLQSGIIFQQHKYGYMSMCISRIHDYMQEHLDEKLTIERISQKFHLSPTTLKTTFCSLYGQPIHQWLQVQRMERAAELLHTTPMSVLQIAQDVGYEGLSQFNVVFKKRYGMTPGQYRKMSKTGEN